MSCQTEKVNETPPKSQEPRPLATLATTYNSLLQRALPLPNHLLQTNIYNNSIRSRQNITLEECWGQPRPTLEQPKNIPEDFGHPFDVVATECFRCITHNINNIPSNSFWPKSKIITKMAQGADLADIRLWQETGLY